MKYLVIVLLSALDLFASAQNLPIKQARTISFETSEGSYMDVDLSPDGRTIVFSLLGDIYSVPSIGGDAVQLTRGLAINLHPVFSPNGKEIACMSDASGVMHINLMDTKGGVRRTLDAQGPQARLTYANIYVNIPVWSPDGNYIAEGDCLYHLAGARQTLPASVSHIIGFSSDGQFVYCAEGKKVQCYNRNNGSVITFAELPKNFSSVIQISPNGKWLTYIIGGKFEGALKSDLVVRDLASKKERILIQGVESNYRTFQEHYAFSSDSRYLFIGCKGKIHKIEIESGIDQIIPFNAKINVDCGALNYNCYKLGNDSLQVKYTRWANQSPDGKSLVFSALNKIYVMTLPDCKPHPLVNQQFGQFQPVYSPDGKWIAYVSRSDMTGGGLWIVSSSGGKPIMLTSEKSPAMYACPAWSFDGTQIAILKDSLVSGDVIGMQRSSKYNQGQLLVISVRDQTGEKLAENIPMGNSLAFSADGMKLLYNKYKQSDEIKDVQDTILVSIDLKTRKIQVLAIQPPPNKTEVLLSQEEVDSYKQISLSPNRKFIAYQINEDLYLSPIFNPGEPVIINSRKGILPAIRFADGMDIHWEEGGNKLCWSYGNKFYRTDPYKIIAAAIVSTKDSINSNNHDGIYYLNIFPDETTTINLKAQKYYAHGTIALKNARIISMKGDGVIERGAIIIKDGRFIAVGTMNEIKIPGGAKIFDIKGKTVIPGLIDLHDHLNTGQDVLQQQPSSFLANLAYGVTTARDPSSNFDSFGYAELLQTGPVIGPRLFSVGAAVNHPLESLEEAYLVARKRALMNAVCVKQYMQPTRLQKQWLLIASEEYGLNMTNEGDLDPLGSLEMIKDGSTGVEHNPYWGNVYKDMIQFIVKSEVWHTPTLQVGRGGAADHYFRSMYRKRPDDKLTNFRPKEGYRDFVKPGPAPADSACPDFILPSKVEARIFKGKGHVAIGAHGNDAGIGSHWEIWALQMGGLSNLEVLHEATIEGAKALGMQEDLGSIEVGKIADLIVLDKNPLEDIHNTMSIHYVMKDGILYDGNTLNELWPQMKECPEWRFNTEKNNGEAKAKKKAKL